MIFKTFKNQLTLRFLIILVITSTTISFITKLMGVANIIPWTIAYNDIAPWSKDSFGIAVPYIDRLIEYPVVIGFVMHIASRNDIFFYLHFHFLIFLASAVIATIFLFKLCEKTGTSKTYLFTFWALSPSLLWFVYFNWDIIAVTFSIVSLYYYKEKKDVLGTIFLSLGFSTKMYPILFLFPLLLHRSAFQIMKMLAVFIVSFLLPNFFFILKNFSTWHYIFAFHSTRGPNIDSIWGLISNIFPHLNVQAINLITLVGFGASYFLICMKFRREDSLRISFLVLLCFLIINKVFSPQYILWLLPFFSIYGERFLGFYLLEISNFGVLFFSLSYIFSFPNSSVIWIFLESFVAARHIILIYVFFRNLLAIKSIS